MDFGFTEEEEKFRREVREFLERECTEEFQAEYEETGERWGREGVCMEITRKLADRGWLTLHWPKEYGGGGASIIYQFILNEEIGYAGVPTGGHRHGINLVGPTLMVHGSEEQKKKHLGAIARTEVVWCEGLSEPEAGSDLAALRTRAVRKGDEYIINGQKVWTTLAHKANWMYLVARTNPEASKTRGISYFLLDMKTPGVEVRPILNMFGSHDFNEVFFDDVRVPAENLVGGENNGWAVVNTLLEVEHSGVGQAAECRRSLDDLIQFCKETKLNGEPLANDPIIRSKLAQMEIEVEVNRMMCYHVGWMQSKGMHSPLEGPMNKASGTELEVRLSKVGMDILGLYGPLNKNSKWARLKGRIEYKIMYNLGQTIAGGTTEIQKYIMATRGLGLPRGPR